jgi:hypothetical protein
MTWFEDLMGFTEQSPAQVRENIEHDGDFLVSRVNHRRVRGGQLSTPSLAELRQQPVDAHPGHATVGEVIANVQRLHRDPENAHALFQAASQFNLLEMVGPSITPEEGVGIYEHDPTQGPACAVACGGGTIYRNYFVPLGDQLGQSATLQIDCLAELGTALGGPGLWEMRNGYALASHEGLRATNERLAKASPDEINDLRGLLRIGVQQDVEVLGTRHLVTQVYGSALPVTYGDPPVHLWEPLARLILEASYEATILVARQLQIDTVFLTLLGGGVFGNEGSWIGDAILRALPMAGAMDVRIVSYGSPSHTVARILQSHTEHCISPELPTRLK